MNKLPELLSAREFSERYPVPGFDEGSWLYWLKKWRDSGELTAGGQYLKQPRAGLRPSYCYLEKRVLRLIWNLSPDIYFRQEILRLHHAAIRIILTTPTAPAPPDNSLPVG